MGRRLFEVVFLLLDGGYFGGFVDLRIDVFYYVGLDILHGRGKVVPEFVVAFLQFGPVETDECHEFALLLRHDGVAYQKMAVQNAFDILRVDVLAVRPDYHAAEPPLDVEESVRVEGAEVARAEPTVGCENLRGEFRILVVSQHCAGTFDHEFPSPNSFVSSSRASIPGSTGPVEPSRTLDGTAPAISGAVSVRP